ncbi:MAG: hypothetical protein IPK44_23890 [Candidatus Accumulibacter sp.]|uniref:hypothetical protein n=1 Tax=Accumulibacter sp. TaxID=2053492 RepID=UPI0025873144|nr:hypothetical protein [Accumulibacter sp.]MBK8117336.1 hypothetical protein [Accumulibacter sp.]
MRFMTGMLVISAMAISGCASNPYITDPRPSYSEMNGANSRSGSACAASGSIEYAWRYADNTYESYEAKLSQEFARQQLLSGGLLTLGASIIAMAVGHANNYWMAGAALTAGTVYQLGTWNSSKDRLGIYIEGMKAVSCAQSAVEPLRIGVSGIANIQNDEARVREDIEHAAKAAGKVMTWLAIVGDQSKQNPSNLERKAESELASMGILFKKGNDAISHAASLERGVQEACGLLENTVRDIRTSVDAAINGTLADLANLPKFINGLSASVNVFAPGLDLDSVFKGAVAATNVASKKGGMLMGSPESGHSLNADREAPVDPVIKLAGALGELSSRHTLLAASISRLKGTLGKAAPSQSRIRNSLAGCGNLGLQLDRSAMAFKAGIAGISMVTLSGGALPYAASFVDLPAPKGISFSLSGAVLVVSATGDTEAGNSIQVKVEDSARATAFLTISVEDKTSSPTTGTTNKSSSVKKEPSSLDAVCIGHQSRSAEELCLIQSVIGVKVTGWFKEKSCQAFLSNPLTQKFGGRINDSSMAAVYGAAGFSDAPDTQQIRAKLSERGVKICRGQPTGNEAGNSTLPAIGAAAALSRPCEVEGSRTDFECRQSKAAVRELRRELGVSPTPEKFDDDLRNALARFQETEKLDQRKGDYTEETAMRLQTNARKAKGLGPLPG